MWLLMLRSYSLVKDFSYVKSLLIRYLHNSPPLVNNSNGGEFNHVRCISSAVNFKSKNGFLIIWV